jgi:hypothetical protein
MPKCLTPAQIEQYREEGCVFPIRIMSETEAAELRGRLEAFERRTGGSLKGDMRHKSHLLFTWLAELVRRSSILDAVEDLHGPDLLCWTTNFFIKEAADPAFVSWHQDSTYWGLSTPDVVTAWVAFTEATEANGAMEYVPGSHKLDQIPHRAARRRGQCHPGARRGSLPPFHARASADPRSRPGIRRTPPHLTERNAGSSIAAPENARGGTPDHWRARSRNRPLMTRETVLPTLVL